MIIYHGSPLTLYILKRMSTLCTWGDIAHPSQARASRKLFRDLIYLIYKDVCIMGATLRRLPELWPHEADLACALYNRAHLIKSLIAHSCLSM